MSGQDHFLVIRGFLAGRRCNRGLVGFVLLFAHAVWGADSGTNWPTATERLPLARATFSAQSNDVTAAIQLAQVCFEASWAATNTAHRARFAEEGIATARQALKQHSAAAGLEYYLALNLGQLASTRGMSALKLVREMETHLLNARKLDETFSDAGPDRSLGYLYLDAPGWPVSVGSHEKARKHRENALRLAPLYPEHALALAEACLRWKEPEAAARYLAQADLIWPQAKERFSGARWQTDWNDWESRRTALKNQLKPR
jgi:tetratricopeptide (TPR) repeat protein